MEFSQTQPSLILVGASVRAAAFSALRAGFVPWCADLFADADLLRRVPCRHVERYPEGFLDILRQAPEAPLSYTGAMENRPELIRKFAALRPLWGNGSDVLRRVRSPEYLAKLCKLHGLPCPRLARPNDMQTITGAWLAKPRKSAGGTGIRFWSEAGSLPRGYYLQEWIEGVACAGIFAGQDDTCQFLGATRQLIGEPWLHAKPFQYCGSVGPWPLTPGQRQSLERVGELLVRATGLRGLFGVDGILRDDVFWPVEVNPRYTASMEILEHTSGLACMTAHARAFGYEGAAPKPPPDRPTMLAKAIVFAGEPLVFPDGGPWRSTLQDAAAPWRWPAFADIPQLGQSVRQGQPILSFFADGTTAAECLANLKQRRRGLGFP